MTREIPLIHPGEILLEDWLKPLGISQTALAKAIAVPPRRIHEIIAGKRAISADTALRLAAFFKQMPKAGSICKVIMMRNRRGKNLRERWRIFLHTIRLPCRKIFE